MRSPWALLTVRLERFQAGALRNRPALHVPPESNEQATGQGHDANEPHALASQSKARIEPDAEGRVGWIAEPALGNRDHQRPDAPVTSFANALVSGTVPAGIGHWGQAGKRGDLLTVVELTPAKIFHHKDPGACESNTTEVHQVRYLLMTR